MYDNSRVKPAALAKGNGEMVSQVYKYDIWKIIEDKK